MIELLLLIPSLILGYLLLRETQRSKDLTEKLISERKDSEAARGIERAEWGQERRQLLNRVQRPDVAVYEDFEPSLEQPYVHFDDDNGFHESQLPEDVKT